MAVPTVMNWSGGKDSGLALYHALRDPALHVTDLFTSVNAHHGRVSMHGVRCELLEAQAQRIGLPLTQVQLPENPSMADYEQRTQQALAPLLIRGVRRSVFGDIYLEDLRRYREQQLAALGLEALFPLWQRPNAELLAEFLALGFRAVIVCVNEQYLDQRFCGRELDADFLRDLPSSVDSCGENGEYHSFVYDAPYFASSIPMRRGEQVRRTYPAPAGSGATEAAFWFQDLLLDDN